MEVERDEPICLACCLLSLHLRTLLLILRPPLLSFPFPPPILRLDNGLYISAGVAPVPTGCCCHTACSLAPVPTGCSCHPYTACSFSVPAPSCRHATACSLLSSLAAASHLDDCMLGLDACSVNHMAFQGSPALISVRGLCGLFSAGHDDSKCNLCRLMAGHDDSNATSVDSSHVTSSH